MACANRKPQAHREPEPAKGLDTSRKRDAGQPRVGAVSASKSTVKGELSVSDWSKAAAIVSNDGSFRLVEPQLPKHLSRTWRLEQ